MQRKNSHAKRKTDQLHHSTRENISQLPIPTKFIPLLPSGEKLGLVGKPEVTDRIPGNHCRSRNQKISFRANCMLNGSPGPIPGAPL
jgi:hypothetical protein